MPTDIKKILISVSINKVSTFFICSDFLVVGTRGSLGGDVHCLQGCARVEDHCLSLQEWESLALVQAQVFTGGDSCAQELATALPPP